MRERVKLACVSVDLDEIPNYHAIHGLPGGAAVDTLVYDLALPRLLDMAASGGFPLTLFAVGSDLSRQSAASGLARAARLGHEIANHSLDHRYDLTRLPRAEIERQISAGASAILAATGVSPEGFRAPGYTITGEVFSVLADMGIAYDSSVFPCPSYYAAKTMAIAYIAARGRRSHSVVDDPRVLTAPVRPYRVGVPYFRRGSGILELPIQVTRGLRLPFIGTTITLAGPDRARWLARMCKGEPLVNLELHGIDLLSRLDGLDALSAHQLDVRVPLQRKLDSLDAVFTTLKDAGYTFTTMAEAARAFEAGY